MMQIGSAEYPQVLDPASEGRRVLILRSGVTEPFGAFMPFWSCLPGWQLYEVTGADSASKLRDLERRGWRPDVVLADTGSTEARHVRTVFPDARLVLQCPVTPDSPRKLPPCDAAVSASWRQRSRYPDAQQRHISVIHPGVSTGLSRVDPHAFFMLPGGKALRVGDPVITIVPACLRAGMPRLAGMIELLQRHHAQCETVIVTDHDDSGMRESIFLPGCDRLDLQRIHFAGNLPHGHWLDLLRVSAVHVDLSAPLVPVQNLIEAMACCCAVVAADADGVREVLRHGVNGQIADGADARAVAGEVARLLHNPAVRASVAREAAFTVLREFDAGTAALRYARVLEGRPVASDPADWAPYALVNDDIALHDYSFSRLGGI